MAETNKKLNPRAPEFIPASTPSAQKPNYRFPLNPFYPNHKPHCGAGGRFLHRKNLPPRLLNKKIWVPKYKTVVSGKTSVMLRNIPNDMRRRDLLSILDIHCWKENRKVHRTPSSYDFLYLPMDFVRHGNLGYAFVNFTTPLAAERFYREFHNFSWKYHCTSTKTCEITVAKFQGKQELCGHFKDCIFPCHTDDYLPVVLSPASDGFIGYRLTTVGRRVGRTRRA